MKHTRVRQAIALLCAASLLLALGACAPSDSKPYASYDLDKLVKLGDYKDVEAQFVTDEEYLDLYMENAVFAQYGAPMGIDNDAEKETIAEGDLVSFDFEGTSADATEADLAGMKGQALLVIGAGNFIEGFESQMVGHPREKEFIVDVTFPDPYLDADGENIETLAGKPAEFKCIVHKIGTESKKVTDEGVSALTGGQYTTVKAFGDVLKPDIEQQYQRPFADLVRQYNMNQAYTAAFSNAEILDIPAKEVAYWDKQLAQEAERSELGSADEYATQNGYENAQALREDQLNHELFSFAVASKEKITVTDEDLEKLLSDIREGNADAGTDKEIYASYGGKGRIIRMLMMEKVSEFIFENAKDSPAAAS